MQEEMEFFHDHYKKDGRGSRSISASQKKQVDGLQNLHEEVQSLKNQLNGMAEELGTIRGVSPVHSRRSLQSPSPQPPWLPPSASSPKQFASEERWMDSPVHPQSLPTAHFPKLPSQAARRPSPHGQKGGLIKNQAAKIGEMEKVQAGLRAQLEATSVDMKRIAAERDLLLELSNSFRADLTRVLNLSGQGAYELGAAGHNFHFDGNPSTSNPALLSSSRRK
ncbi:unnamed protein product [Sphagnum troendelagicum]|uniref:BZIP transcription factor n=1 Tax=Sphagnum troendelagicum TaxID=128251 RepID=A0ABP0UFL4_9BRYO